MRRNRVDGLLQELSGWELRELRELQAALGGLIEALDTDTLDTDELEAETAEAGPTQEVGAAQMKRDRPVRKQRGHIEEKYIPRGKKLHGPYRYLRYYEGGKLRSKYLGKAPK